MQNIGMRCFRPDGAEYELGGFNQAPSLVQKLPPRYCKNMIPRQNVTLAGFPCRNLAASTPKMAACALDSSLASSALERNADFNYMANGYIFDGGEPGVRESYYFAPTLTPRINNEDTPSGRCNNVVYPVADVTQTRAIQLSSQPEEQSFFNRNHTDFVKTTCPLPSELTPESGMATVNSIERNILKMREALDSKYSRREDDEAAYWAEQGRKNADKPFASTNRPICEKKPGRCSLLSRSHESPKRPKERLLDWGDENSDYEEYPESNTPHDDQKSPLRCFSEEQLCCLEKRKKDLSLELEKNIEKIRRDLSRSPNRSLKKVSDKSLDINKKYKMKETGCPTAYDDDIYGSDERDKKNNMKRQIDVEYGEKSYKTLSKNHKRRMAINRLNAIKRDMAVECLAVLLATPEEMNLITSEDDLDNDSWEYFENLSKLPKERLDDISEPVYHTESSNSNEFSNDIDFSYENETRGKNHNMNRSYARKNIYYDTSDEMNDGHKCQIRNISQPRGYKEYQDVSPQQARNDFMDLYNSNRSVPEEQLCTISSCPLAK